MTDKQIRLVIEEVGPQDIEALQAIETSAAQLFLDSPYPELAGFPPYPCDRYLQHMRAKDPVLLGSIVLGQDRPVKAGFAVAEPLADGLHLFELSVHKDWQGYGLGKAMVQQLQQIARQRGYGQITLTTYRSLPWNGPFYEKLGFDYLAPNLQSAEISDILRKEIKAGANQRDRCAMRWLAV